jgi:hypothetical protein
MFGMKTFTIYPMRATRRPMYVRAANARAAIYEFGWACGLVTMDIVEKNPEDDVAYIDFKIGTGEAFYVYETLESEIKELGGGV